VSRSDSSVRSISPPCRNHICCCSVRTGFHSFCARAPSHLLRADHASSLFGTSPSHTARAFFLSLFPGPRCFRLAMTDMEDPLARIPNDILVDSVLPACSPQSLAALGATSRRWHDFIATAGSPCEILWQRRAVRDFKFPVHSTGRRTGWYRLYTQLASSSALVWGVESAAPGTRATHECHSRLTHPTRRRTRTGGSESRPSDGPLRPGSRTLSAVALSAEDCPYRLGSGCPNHRPRSLQEDGPSTH
jgi:hypothetical protein